MRVLVAANTRPASGGVSRHITEVSRELTALGCAVEIFWQPAGSPRLPAGLATPYFSTQVARHLGSRRTQIDILHTHGADGIVAGHFLPPGLGHVITSHGDLRRRYELDVVEAHAGGPPLSLRANFANRLIRLPLYGKSLSTADAVIVLTEYERAYLRGRRETRWKDVFVVPNGCNPPRHNPQPEVGRVVFVGSPTWRKGIDRIGPTMRALANLVPFARWSLVGPGPDVDLGLSKADLRNVEVCGWQDKRGVENTLAAADVLFFPSRFEGMPLAVLESFAHGVPVVGTDIPSLRALRSGGIHLVDPPTPTQFAKALATVITDRAEHERLARLGREWAAKTTWADVAQSTLAIYETVARRHRGG